MKNIMAEFAVFMIIILMSYGLSILFKESFERFLLFGILIIVMGINNKLNDKTK